MQFQKTLIYKKSKCPPEDDIISIGKGGSCIIQITHFSEQVMFTILNNSEQHTATELYQVVIGILIKYPFSEFPFEENNFEDFINECGGMVDSPDILN